MHQDTQQPARVGVLIAYSVLLMVGAAFLFGSFDYVMQREDGRVGPAYLPRYASILVMALSILLIIQELRGRSHLAGDSGAEESATAMTKGTLKKLLIVFALITGSLLIAPYIGLIPALSVLVAILTIGVERMPVIPSLLFTVAAGAGAYFIFIIFLRVPIPMGILEGIL